MLIDNLGDEFVAAVSKQLNKCSESNYYNLIYISGIILPHYLEWTVSYLKKHIPHGSHKTEIEQGIRSWFPELIMRGYSAEYIYNCVESLAKGVVSSLDALDAFFDRFDFKKKICRVYLQISEITDIYGDVIYNAVILYDIKTLRSQIFCKYETK